MSLIDPKNFVKPFYNIWHLATIVLVALLMAVYRLAGGGIDIEAISKPIHAEYIGQPRKLASEEKTTEKALESQIERKAPVVPVDNNQVPKKPNLGDSLLDDLVSNKPPPKTGRREIPAGESPLDEIARQLGEE